MHGLFAYSKIQLVRSHETTLDWVVLVLLIAGFPFVFILFLHRMRKTRTWERFLAKAGYIHPTIIARILYLSIFIPYIDFILSLLIMSVFLCVVACLNSSL